VKQAGIQPIPPWTTCAGNIEQTLTEQKIDQVMERWLADTRTQVAIRFQRRGPAMSRRKKIWVFGLGGLLGLLLLTLLTAVVVVQTDWFKNKVRARIISEAENATGGRVEIGSFDYDCTTSQPKWRPS